MGESSTADEETERYSDEKTSEERAPGEALIVLSTQSAVLLESKQPNSEGGSTSRSWFKRGKKDGKPKYDESLFKAIHRTFFARIWTAGVLKLISGELSSPFYSRRY